MTAVAALTYVHIMIDRTLPTHVQKISTKLILFKLSLAHKTSSFLRKYLAEVLYFVVFTHSKQFYRHFYRRPLCIVLRKEYLTNRQIICLRVVPERKLQRLRWCVTVIKVVKITTIVSPYATSF